MGHQQHHHQLPPALLLGPALLSERLRRMAELISRNVQPGAIRFDSSSVWNSGDDSRTGLGWQMLRQLISLALAYCREPSNPFLQ